MIGRVPPARKVGMSMNSDEISIMNRVETELPFSARLRILWNAASFPKAKKARVEEMHIPNCTMLKSFRG
jgi:hypothetical protein